VSPEVVTETDTVDESSPGVIERGSPCRWRMPELRCTRLGVGLALVGLKHERHVAIADIPALERSAAGFSVRD